MNKNPSIAFLGMGTMGAHMARNLSRAGLPVIVWNRNTNSPSMQIATSFGASIAETPAKAAETSNRIFSCLTDTRAVHDVYFGPNGIVHGIQSETIVVDCSTIGPKAAVAVSEKLRPYNVDFLDAPITGGDIGAKEASLVFMVGGDAVRFWEIESLLGHMGKTSYHCGAVGSGQSMKLVNQLLCGVNMLAVAEAIQLTKEMRIDPKLMIEICAGGAGGSWALKHLGPRIVQSELQSGFKVAHMLKDLNLVIDAVGKTAALPALSLAQQHFSKLATMNGGQFNSYATQAIALLYDDSSR